MQENRIPAQLLMNYWPPGDEWGSPQDSYCALAANMGGGIPLDVIREHIRLSTVTVPQSEVVRERYVRDERWHR